METYVSIMFLILIGMLLAFLWLRRKAAPWRKYAMSDEATKEVGSVLGNYRQTLAIRAEAVRDIRLLPDSKDIIKQYLQVAIGLARLNREPYEGLLDDYYQLARFQDMRVLRSPVVTASGTAELAEEMGQRYEEVIARETETLERELKAFLKRKRLF